MDTLFETQERYSHLTLSVMYYGVRFSGETRRNIMRVTFINKTGDIHTAPVLGMGSTSVFVDLGGEVISVYPDAIIGVEAI